MTLPNTAPLAWLGDDEVTVLRATLVTGRYGAQSRDWAHPSEVRLRGASVQPTVAREDTAGREFSSTRCLLLAPSTVDLEATDRVRWHGVVYELDGPPQVWRGPSGEAHHVEAVLLRMTG